LTDVGTMTRPCQHPGMRGERRAWRSTAGCLCSVLLCNACTNTVLDLFNPDLGLLAHWALDESRAGRTVVDSSAFGNDGAPSESPPVPTDDVPPVGFHDPFSLSFNGEDQWIDLGNPPLLNGGGPISVAAWLRATRIDTRSNVVAHGFRFDPDYDFALRLEAGTYVFTTWDGIIDHRAVTTVPSDDVGSWVHLCGVFDGTRYRLYRNGALAASTEDKAAPQANVDTAWAIGASASGLENLLQGQIDDVRIYGRALSSAEVQALYRR
jgi:hypothetical protein